MATVGEIYRDFAYYIDDIGNDKIVTQRILRWINKAISESVSRLDSEWAIVQLTGQYKLTVVDYSGLSGDVITSVQTTAGTSAFTEGVNFTAATSNTVTAAAIATAINASSSHGAWSDGAVVYICGLDDTFTSFTCDADTDYITIADAGYEVFNIGTILTRFRRVHQIYDTTNECLYHSMTRAQYDRLLIDSNNTAYAYYVSPGRKLYLKADGSNVDSSGTFHIHYFQYPADLTLASESPPGLLADYDELILQRVLYYYYISQGMYNEANAAYTVFARELKRAQQEIWSQGEPQSVKQLYRWH